MDLSDRTTDDLRAVLAAHKAREIRLTPQHIKAIRAELNGRTTQ